MLRVPVALGAFLVVLSTLTACGSRADTSEPIEHDIVALRAAAAAGSSDEAVRALSSLLSAAHSVPNDREGWKGEALIRARFSSILTRFLRDYSRTRQRLSHVQTTTDGGAAIKSWLLRGYEGERRELLQLGTRIAGGSYAWGAILTWEGAHNAAIVRSDSRLRAIVRGLPPAQQQAAGRALG
jgi:hypothetical protein